MYKVIKHFVDLQDNNHPYNVGDVFPRDGLEVSAERIAELAGSYNKQKTPLIAEVEETPEDKPEEKPEKPTKKGAKKTAEE